MLQHRLGHLEGGSGGARLAPEGVVGDGLEGVGARGQSGLAVEEYLARPRVGPTLERRGERVVLAQLGHDPARGVAYEDQNREVLPEEVRLRVSLKLKAAGGNLHHDRGQGEGRGFGKLQSAQAHGNVGGQRSPLEPRQGRGLVLQRGHGQGGVEGQITLAGLEPAVGAKHLHRDGSELTVVVLPPRRVGQHVVGAQVLVHLQKPGAEVVRIADQEPAGLRGQAAQARLGGETQGVFDELRPRARSHVGRAQVRGPAAHLCRLHRALRLEPSAGDAQAPRIGGVEAHVCPVGRGHHGTEGGVDSGGNGEALGHEHHGLAPGKGLEAGDEGEQGLRGREAGKVALEGLEGLDHAALEYLLASNRVGLVAAALGGAGELCRGHVRLTHARGEPGVSVADRLALTQAGQGGGSQ